MIHQIIKHAIEKSGIAFTEERNEIIEMIGTCGAFSYEGFYAHQDNIPWLNSKELIAINPVRGPYSDAQLARIFLHELSHACGAMKRLNRPTLDKGLSGGEDCYVEEMIADWSSKLLMDHFGFNSNELPDDQSAYVMRNMSEIDPSRVEFLWAYAQTEAEKAKNWILENWLCGIEFADQKVG